MKTAALLLCYSALIGFFLPEKKIMSSVYYSNNTVRTLAQRGKDSLELLNASFLDEKRFTSYWNLFYPWGTDHNGSARMYESDSLTGTHIELTTGGILRLSARRVALDEGNSHSTPFHKIRYHSGTVYLKKLIRFSEPYGKWLIKGDFRVPTSPGTWPAFWITGAEGWPPESDIMEFKGNNRCFQNTMTGPGSRQVHYQNAITSVKDADHWHTYSAWIEKIDSNNVRIRYYIDGVLTGVHRADFMNKPFYLIIDLQMEGDSGPCGPDHAEMFAKNIKVMAYQNF